MFTSFQDAVSYTFATYNRSKPHRMVGLDRDTRTPHHTRELLDALGSPDMSARNIKVTGSKGKGSTSRLLSGLLQSQGYRVGLFTSPHLIDFTERIRVNGRAISEDEFMRILALVKDPLDQIASGFAPHEYFGPVGVTAVVAARYFREQGTDVNVIELGRGARFDDVNMLRGELAVVTPVQCEHANYLGPTLVDIAWNKAGVITAGLRGVVLGEQVPEAKAVLIAEAEMFTVPVLALGEHVFVSGIKVTRDGTKCSVRTPRAEYGNLDLALRGRHQAENLGVALAAAEQFMDRGCAVIDVRSFVRDVSFPGRCQWIAGKPQVLIDGAINRQSAAYVKELVGQCAAKRVAAIVGVPEDKDYLGVLEAAASFVQHIVVTVAQNPQLAFSPDAFACSARLADTESTKSVPEAIQKASAWVGEDGLVVILGTQSVIAEALDHFRVPTRDL